MSFNRFGWGVAPHGQPISTPAPSGGFDSEEQHAADDPDPAEMGDSVDADPDYSGDPGEYVEAAEDVDAGGGAPDSAGELGADLEPAEPNSYPGVMIAGDPLKAAQMEKTWAVGEIEAARIGEYDLDMNASSLALLRSMALAAKEGAAPDLSDTDKETLQALESFDAWIRSIRVHADSLRNSIRTAGSLDALTAIDIEHGWPE